MKRESALFRRALDKWKDCPNLRLLGVGDSPRSDRIAIFSFLIHCPEAGTYLHHNFVAALLNDLFGIQVFTLALTRNVKLNYEARGQSGQSISLFSILLKTCSGTFVDETVNVRF